MSTVATESATPDEVSIVVRGLSTSDLRRKAVRRCELALGRQDCWCFTQAEVVPCMKTLGGHVRLYEGRFVACRTSGVTAG
jgi:hypothetical protein